ncbi:MAG: LytTR family DNA-binding domain-containing protein [Saprospiraceae bacterium]|nr:LytTR family DNA-binding domain-containing protein [Saprospiraceae bacterium]
MKCIIIDDDPLITDLVMHFSDKCELIEYCVACNDSVEGLKLLTNSNFDILFLDYNMPDFNGRDLLELKKDKSKVIMITSNKDFAVDSYQYEDVTDYLLKPLDYESFLKSILRIETKRKDFASQPQEKTKDSLMVKDGNNWIPILFKDIQFIKSESNYCVFYTLNGKTMSLAKLKDLEVKLPPSFIRCHRSFIVNTSYISKINLEEIQIGTTLIPISQMFKENIKKFIESNS